MKYNLFGLTFAILLLGLIVSSCNAQDDTVSRVVTRDYSSLIDNLQKEGANVEHISEVEQPFFTVKGSVIKVNGDDVQVFEYKEESAANQESTKIPKDGITFDTIVVDWISEPHFYKSGKLIVLYVGKNKETIGLLDNVLGHQFAGAKSQEGKPISIEGEIDCLPSKRGTEECAYGLKSDEGNYYSLQNLNQQDLIDDLVTTGMRVKVDGKLTPPSENLLASYEVVGQIDMDTVTHISPLLKKIPTGVGDLMLKYEKGVTTLSGILTRSTPCVHWTVEIKTKDSPISQVTINIFDSNKGVICIQILGEPQEIYEEIEQVSQETIYTVKLEQEVVFEGTINSLDTRDSLIVEIPSTFLLSEGHTAKITNHEDEEITLTEIGTDSIKLTVYFPGGCGPNSDPRCLGPPSFQKEYDLKVGEIIDVMGITIKFQYISKNFANLSIKLQN